jgi:endonuclease I
MKKAIFFVFVMLFTLSATLAFANNPDTNSEAEKNAVPVKTENKLSDEEVDRITKRVKEIRKMDKSDLTAEEKGELKNELKEMKKDVKKAGGTVYIGGATLVLIIILVLLLV